MNKIKFDCMIMDNLHKKENKLVESIVKTLPVIAVIFFWELLSNFAKTPLFPSFFRVISEVWILTVSGVLIKNAFASIIRVLFGFVLGSVSGFLTGVFIALNSFARKVISPILSILYPIPALGWVPLLMIWIGINELLPVTIIAITAFFPVFYNTVTGIQNVDEGYVKVAKTLGAKPLFILFKVIIPLAVPDIFTGIRLAAGMGWRAVLAAEMIAIPKGLGAMMTNAESLIRVDIIMSCLMCIGVFSFLLEKIGVWLEKRIKSYQGVED